MLLESERKILDSFTDRRESVRVDLVIPADQVVIEVIWPAGSRLESVDLERPPHPARTVLQEINQLPDGRHQLSVKIDDPTEGDKIYVIWRWPGAKR